MIEVLTVDAVSTIRLLQSIEALYPLLCRLLGRLPSRTHPHAPPTGVREAPMHEIAEVGH
jgi:hypothetical protein